MAQKPLTYDVTHKKSRNPNQKCFFQVQTRRLAESFDGLNSSPAQSTKELGRWVDFLELNFICIAKRPSLVLNSTVEPEPKKFMMQP